MTITAVFGIDDFTEAYLEIAEAVDVCAVAGNSITTADMPLAEAVDNADIEGEVVGLAVLAITENVDGCYVFAGSVLDATIAITENADICRAGAIAPTSIIGHGKKFKIKPHDPSAVLIVTTV